MVGLILPASVGGALTNIALLLAGKIPVNLNFTAGSEAMAASVEQCGIKTIITSRVFLAKADVEKMAGMGFFGGDPQKFSPLQKNPVTQKAFPSSPLLLPPRLVQRHHPREPPTRR